MNTSPSFGFGDGKVLQPIGAHDDLGQSMLLQPDGKVVVAGYSGNGTDDHFSIARFNADGTLDTVFGSGGKTIVPFNGTDQAYRVALQADGKLVVAGYSTNGGAGDFAVTRLNANGSVDTSFGVAGKVLVDLAGGADGADCIVVQSDGKVVIAGTSANAGRSEFGLVRLNADGSLDTTFGVDGKLQVGVGTGNAYVYGLAQQANGALVVAGYAESVGGFDFAAIRVDADGVLDTSFGPGGAATVSLGAPHASAATSVLVQPQDGYVVLTGNTYDTLTGVYAFAATRLKADGTLDTSFGDGGHKIVPIGGVNDEGSSAVLQPDGSILIGGMSQDAGNVDYAVVKLTGAGQLDSSFGDGGTKTIAVGTGVDVARAIALQPDGRIVLAGESQNGAGKDFSLIRLTADGTLDTSFDNVRGVSLGGTVDTVEQAAPVVLDTDVVVHDVELEAAGSFGGAILTLARAGGANAHDVFSATGTLASIAQGNPIVVSGTTIGTVTHNGAGSLVLTFDANATQALVSEALQGIGYTNDDDDPPASVTLDWAFSDGNTGAQGAGGAQVGHGTTVVNIAPVNDAPTVTNVSASGAEDTVIPIVLSGADVDGVIASYTVTALPGHGALYADAALTQAVVTNQAVATPNLYFKPDQDWNGATSLQFKVTDDEGADSAATANASISVSMVNDAPEFVLHGGQSGDVVVTEIGSGISFTEDGPPTVLGVNAGIRDVDLAAIGAYTGSTLSLSRRGGASAQDQFSSTGLLGVLVEGGALTYDGITIGTVTTNSAGTLTLSFAAAATQAAVDGVVSSLAYANSSDAPPASVTLDWTFGDGNTGAQGTGGTGEAHATTTVSIVAVNDAPVATNVSASGLEDAASIAVTLAGTDVDGTVTGYVVTALPAHGALFSDAGLTQGVSTGAVIAGPTVYFRPDRDWNGTVQLGFKAVDIEAAQSSLESTAAIEIGAVNDAPTFDPLAWSGKIVAQDSGIGQSVLIQSDGKIVVSGTKYFVDDPVVSGSISAIRFHPDGSLDSEFSGDGMAVVGVNSRAGYGSAAAMQPDGKILIAGVAYHENDSDFCVSRFTKNGELDTEFGIDGVVVVPVGLAAAVDEAHSIVVQADGKLVVVGTSRIDTVSGFSAIRLNADGSLDSSFGNGGKVQTHVGESHAFAYSSALQQDGKLLISGHGVLAGKTEYALVRLNANGSLDTSLDGTGKVLVPVGINDSLSRSVIVQSDGKIVLSGMSIEGSSAHFSAIRLQVDGTIDATFGTEGATIVPADLPDEIGFSAAIQSDGKIVLVGESRLGRTSDVEVVRLGGDGHLDETFGDNGKVIFPVGPSVDEAFSVAIEADGKLVIAGASGFRTGYRPSVVRLNQDGTLDSSFGVPSAIGTLRGEASYTEDSWPILLEPDAIIFDAELDAGGSFDGASLSIARSGGANSQDHFTASDNLAPLVEGGAIAFSGTEIGSVVSNSAGQLTLAFTQAATPALVNATLNSIAYENSSHSPPVTVVLDWTFSDGNSGAQGPGGPLLAHGTTTVNITPVNSLPVAVAVSAIGNEDAATIPITLSATDEDSPVVGFSIVTSPAHGTLYRDAALSQAVVPGTVVAGPTLYYVPYANSSGNTSFTYTAHDDVGGVSAPATASITVQAVDDTPNFLKGDGLLLQPIAGHDVGQSMLLQPDGKVVVAGYSGNGADDDFSIARFNADGTLDAGFGAGGKAVVPFNGTDQAYRVALQADGKLVVAGYSTNGGAGDFAVTRLNANGSVDTSFGVAGKVLVDLAGGADGADCIVVQSDGKVVIAGTSENAGRSEFGLVRLNGDGSLDTTFGAGGKLQVGVGTGNAYVYGLAQQANGALVVAGYAESAIGFDFAAIRVDADGVFDTGFGSGGTATVSLGAPHASAATSVLVQPGDGYVVLVGNTYDTLTGVYAFAATRLKADGTLDTSFGDGGHKIVPIGGVNDEGSSAVLQPDGSILIGGMSQDAGNVDYAVVKLTGAGQLDSSFGDGGTKTIAVGTGVDVARAIALQPDGRIVLAGESQNGAGKDFSLIRLTADGTLDTSFDNVRGVSLGGTVDTVEQAAPVVLDTDVVVHDVELEAAGSFGGAILTLARAGGANAHDVFSATGTLASIAQGNPIVVSGTTIGTVTHNGAGSLVLTFDANATQALVSEALQGIGYTNDDDDPPASVTLDWAFSDGNTGAQGAGGAQVGHGTTTVNIVPVNDAPTVTNVTASGAEDTVIPIVLSGADVDGVIASYTVTALPGHGTLYANAEFTQAVVANQPIVSPNVYFKPDQDWNGATSFQFKVTDDEGADSAATASASISVSKVNDAPRFGPADGTGKVIVPIAAGPGHDEARSIVVQPDGMLVVLGTTINGTNGGDFSVIRLEATGALDPSFGVDGKLVVPVGSAGDGATSVVIQADGKLVLTGYSQSNTAGIDFSAVRVTSNGALDLSFGTSGEVLLSVDSPQSIASDSVIQPDGKLVLVGTSNTVNSDDFSAIRLATNGTIDPSFGNDGKVVVPVGTYVDRAHSVALQPNGKLLLAGTSYNGANSDFSVIRLDANGGLDQSFGIGGRLVVPVGSSQDEAYGVVVQPDGKIVLAGQSWNESTWDFSAIRLDPHGGLDQTFGDGGKLLLPITSSGDFGNDVVLQPDGKIVVAGYSYSGTSGTGFSAVRLATNGAVDLSFGLGGKVVVPIGTSNAQAFSVALQPDGKLVLAGRTFNGASGDDFGVIRLTSDGILDPTFDLRGDTLGGSVSFTEDAPPVILDSDVAIYDADLAATPSYAGASLTIARTTGANAEDFFFSTGNLDPLAEGGALAYNHTRLGTVTHNRDGSLTLSFDSGANQTLLNNALRSIAYSNSSDTPPASVELTWTFSDGNTGAQGPGGPLTATGTTTVLITPVNDAPIGTPTAVLPTGFEDHAFTLTSAQLLQGFSDPDGDALSVANLTAEHGVVTPNGDGSFNVVPWHDFTGTLQFTYTVTDDHGGDVAATQSTTIAPADDAPSFGEGDGLIRQAIGTAADSGHAVLVQSDGKVVVAGSSATAVDKDFGVVRFNADGSLDTGFGAGGRVVLPVGIGDDEGYALGQQPDGKLVVAGNVQGPGGGQFGAVRLNADGSVDTGFGTAGAALVSPAVEGGVARALALLPDGKILVAGSAGAVGATDFAVVRLNADGSVDTSFGTDGKAVVGISAGDDTGYGIAVQSNGKMIVGGFSASVNGYDISAVRLNANGSIDPSFGNVGKVTVPVGSLASGATSVLVQPDGKVVLAGNQYDGTYRVAVVRLEANGTPDLSFAGTGKQMLTVGGSDDQSFSTVLQPDGKLLVGGLAMQSGKYDFALIRLNADGSFDTSFGNGGKVIQAVSAGDDKGWSIALQPDGRILIAGESTDVSGTDVGLFRLNPDGSLDTSFDTVRTGTLGGTVNTGEHGAPVVLDADVVVHDAELDAAGSFAGATLTLARAGGADVHDLFSNAGALAPITQDAQIQVGVTTIGTVTHNGDGSLVLTFGAGATQALVSEALRGIAYANDSDNPPASVTLDWTLSDGNSGAQGSGGAQVTHGTTVVAISSVNNPPTATNVSATAPEDAPSIPVTLTATDPDGTIAGFQLATLPAHGTLYADAAQTQAIAAGATVPGPTVYFKPDADWNGTTSFGFKALDNTGALSAAAATATIDVTAVNDAPRVVDTIPAQSVGQRVPYAYTLSPTTFVEVDAGDTDTFAATSLTGNALSAWLSFNPATATFSGTPGNADLGSSTIRVTATDTHGASANTNLTITVTSNNGLVGTSGNDSLVGSAANDWIEGLAGNDTLNGGAGADTLDGGAGNDTFVVDNVGDVLLEQPNDGTDVANASVSYTLPANVDNLTLTGTALAGTGNELANTITGNALANTLAGGDGNDALNGSAGTDTMSGGTGNDTYTVDNAGDVVVELPGEGADLVRASVTYTLPSDEVENLTLTGTAAIDGTGNALPNSLVGNAAANVLNGGDGDDTLSGAAAADTLVGGLGNDSYVVDNSADVIVEASGEGTDVVSASASYVLSANVESLTLTGTAAIDGTGSDDANTIVGNAAANVLDGAGGNDTLTGAGGGDTLRGGDGDDLFRVTGTELAGDSFDGGIGTDTIVLGGNVTLASANVSFTGVEFIDFAGFTLTLQGVTVYDFSSLTAVSPATINGDTTANTITGTQGADKISGSSANDAIGGAGGADTLIGGAGADTLAGGAGDDVFQAGGADLSGDVIDGGADNDTLRFTSAVTLAAAGLQLTSVETLDMGGFALAVQGTTPLNLSGLALLNRAAITGDTAANVVTGTEGADSINGGTGDDVLAGGGGDDTLVGAAGLDALNGGAGEDVFKAGSAELTGDVIDGGANADTLQFTSNVTLAAGGFTFSNLETLDMAGFTLAVQGSTPLNLSSLALLNGAAISGDTVGNVITGTTGGDSISGGTGDDTLAGAAGADTLVGGAGLDALNGGAGDDVFKAGSTELTGDVIDGGADTDTLQFTSNVTLAAGGFLFSNLEALDMAGFSLTVQGVTPLDLSALALANGGAINGDAGDNSITGTSGADSISGAAGNDQLSGAGGDDTLVGGAGIDTVNGGAGNDLIKVGGTELTGDVIDGGADVDTLQFTSAITLGAGGAVIANVENLVMGGFTLNVQGTTALDLSGFAVTSPGAIVGDTASNTITGSAIGDSISGGTGNDLLAGGGGADTLVGGAGADTLGGGAGDDLFKAGGTELTGDAIDGGADNDTLQFTSAVTLGAAGFTFTGIETLDMGGFALAVQGTLPLDLSTLALVNPGAINGDAANNTITGSAIGDSISGGAGNDVLSGGGGADTIVGGAGADTLGGGAGNDVFRVGGTELSGDAIDGGADADTIQFTSAVTLSSAGFSSTGVETLDMGGFALTVQGTTALDLSAFAVVNVGAITGDSAANVVTGTGVADTINGGAGNDVLHGGGGADVVDGSTGNDTVYGGAGADRITGGAGNDALFGGPDATGLDGAADVFVFNAALSATTNVDTITGFEADGTDHLLLDPAIFLAIAGGPSTGLDASEFRAAAGGAAADANDYVLLDTANGKLYYDADGNGAGAKVQFATLVSIVGVLDATDFTIA